MTWRIVRCVVPILTFGATAMVLAGPCPAQTALERLERQIDRLLGPLSGQRDQSQDATDSTDSSSTEQEGNSANDGGLGQGQLPEPLPRGESQERLVDGSLRPYLGVTVTDLNASNRRDLDVPVRSGALVETVVEGSPAHDAEIEPGSVVVAIDGRRVDRGADLVVHLQRKRPGEEVVLLYYHGTRLQRSRITLAAIEAAQLNLPSLEAPAIDAPPTIEPEIEGEQGSEDRPPARLELFDRTDGRLLPRLGNRNQDDLMQIIEQQQQAIEALERRIAELERRINAGG